MPTLPSQSNRRKRKLKRPLHPFLRAFWHGLAMILPPVLTMVILVEVSKTVDQYLFDPLRAGVRTLIVNQIIEVRDQLPYPSEAASNSSEKPFQQLANGQYVPLEIVRYVQNHDPSIEVLSNERILYERYVELVYLPLWLCVPVFIVLLLTGLYGLGRLMAVGIGRFFGRWFHGIVDHLPLIRNVYSSVKQVTDFLINDRPLEFSRIVAVQYPRHGIWALAFVTGEGMMELESKTSSSLVSLLVPTAPIPLTGYTMMMDRNEILDIPMSIDQACQYFLSCGVVIPAERLPGKNAVPLPPQG